MARFTLAVAGALTDVDTSQRNPFGIAIQDEAGNEYVYLKGVGSTVVKDAVIFDPSTFLTTRLVVDKAGPVAVALAAIAATTSFGWYQVRGSGSVNSDTVAGTQLPLYVDGTAGRVDDATSAGDCVLGMTSLGADTANVLPVALWYPFVSHSGYLT